MNNNLPENAGQNVSETHSGGDSDCTQAFLQDQDSGLVKSRSQSPIARRNFQSYLGSLCFAGGSKNLLDCERCVVRTPAGKVCVCGDGRMTGIAKSSDINATSQLQIYCCYSCLLELFGIGLPEANHKK